jgi:GxxExxY protein
MIETQRHRDTERGQLNNTLSYKIIIEVKAIEKDNPIHQVQLLTYLRLTGLKLGLLINFGSRHLKDGINRVING